VGGQGPTPQEGAVSISETRQTADFPTRSPELSFEGNPLDVARKTAPF
jgi:hypothetical protein